MNIIKIGENLVVFSGFIFNCKVNSNANHQVVRPYLFNTDTNKDFIFFIIKGLWTIVFIFLVVSTMIWLICPPAFFRYLSNSGTFTELWTMSFIRSMGVACSDSISHNQVQVLSIVTRMQSGLNLQPPDDYLLRSLGNQHFNCYAMCPAGLFRVSFWDL